MIRGSMRRIFVFFIGIITALFLLEVGTRLFGHIYQMNRSISVRPLLQGQSKPFIILCLGNSYTAGDGALPHMSYPAQLERMFASRIKDKDVLVINEGVGNQNTAELLRALKSNIKTYHPELIILQTGQPNSWNYLKYTDYLRRGKKDVTFLEQLSYYLSEFLHESVSYRLYSLFRYNGAHDFLSFTSGFENEKKYQKFVKFRKERENAGNYAAVDHAQMVEALDLFMKAIKAHPGHPQNYFEVAFLYRIQNNYKEAVKWYLKAYDVALASDWRPMLFQASKRIRDIRYMDKGLQINKEINEFVSLKPNQRINFIGLEESDVSEWVMSDIKEVVRIIQHEKIVLIIQNYPRAFPVNVVLSTIAKDLKLPFVDNYDIFNGKIAQGIAEEELFVPDNHCSAKGYGVIAENLFNKIMEEGFLKVVDKKR